MKRVLIVDDEPVMRRLISTWLRGRYITDEAEDGENALSKTWHTDYDCVITDVQMPRMDGLLLLGAIKRLRPCTTVIVMSGLAEMYAAAALAQGASSVLSKPFRADALNSALQYV